MGKLDGRVALVTGAGTSGGPGMGEYAAKGLAAEGAKVVVVAHNFANAQRVSDEIIAAGGEALPVSADVSSFADGEKVVNAAIEKFGKLDIVCLVAGTTKQATIDEMTEDQFDYMVGVNLKQCFNICHFAAKNMKENGYGRIVIYASRGAFGAPEAPCHSCGYSASKAGVIGFCSELSLELADCEGDFKVNCVLPAAATKLFPNSRKAAYGGVPTPWPATPDMTEPMTTYLCLEECACTGEVFYIAGPDVGLYPRDRKVMGYMHKGNGEKWTVDELCEQVPGTFSWYFNTRPAKSNYVQAVGGK